MRMPTYQTWFMKKNNLRCKKVHLVICCPRGGVGGSGVRGARGGEWGAGGEARGRGAGGGGWGAPI